jgi:hypothetical protein
MQPRCCQIRSVLPVTIGRDFGAEVKVVSGLKPTDAVIENPADSLISGAAVRISDRVE